MERGGTPSSAASPGDRGASGVKESGGASATPEYEAADAGHRPGPRSITTWAALTNLRGFMGGPRAMRERIAAQGIVYLLFILTCIAFAIWAPDFATTATLQDIGRDAAPVAVVSVGMTFVIIAAEIDLSVASTISLAGLLGAQVLSKQGIPWPVGLVTSLAVGAGVGVFNGLLVGYLGVPSFLITLGTLEGIGALALMVTGTLSVPITSPGFLDLFGPGSWLGLPLTVWWAILVVLAGAYLLHGTKFGAWVQAVGDSRNAARYAGISRARVVLAVFALSGLLAGFTGVLLAGRTTSGDPTAGTDMELTAIAAVILGGTDLFGGSGTIIGTVIGALFLSAIQVGLILLGASGQLQTLVTGIIIVVIVTINSLARGLWKQ
jgi:ribose/xylose/arabinose/galactoside ABC-type transport system permease subunit